MKIRISRKDVIRRKKSHRTIDDTQHVYKGMQMKSSPKSLVYKGVHMKGGANDRKKTLLSNEKPTENPNSSFLSGDVYKRRERGEVLRIVAKFFLLHRKKERK